MLYSSGEESEHQIKSRGDRLGSSARRSISWRRPASSASSRRSRGSSLRFIIVDSIQTVFSLKFQSAPGSIGQVREAATQLLFAAKGQNIPTFLVGHVTKDGSLAGPKALEHVVDTVLYFEGERHHAHRIVRAVKNRFGAVSELGVFEMTGTGFAPVPNPSKLFLAERPANAPGSAVLCCVEGSRPMLVEVQALVSTAPMATRGAWPAASIRTACRCCSRCSRNGQDSTWWRDDVFVNVAGGITVDEPAADLAIVAAVASSVRNRPVKPATAVFGEVGLAGEIRGISQAALRVSEAAQMGFTRCIVPHGNLRAGRSPAGCRAVGGEDVCEALDAVDRLVARPE